MKNNIKEILFLSHNDRLTENGKRKLEDYINNLQQENISLAKENEQEKQFIKDCGFENAQQLVLDYIGIRQEKEDYKSRIEKAVEYINNFSIEKSFSFPLMKRWEENQVKSSIDYEFNDTLKKDLLNILNGKE